jgi:hypothetical protein
MKKKTKKNCLSGKKKRISFCSSASVDFCLFALSAGRVGTGRHCSTEGPFGFLLIKNINQIWNENRSLFLEHQQFFRKDT